MAARPDHPVVDAAWRLLLTPDRPGPWNMACDHALAEGVARGGPPVLRLYGWSPHALSFGYAQPVRRLGAALDALRRRGLGVVRRPTGGGAVLHARELTYAVALPAGRGARVARPREACAAIHRALAAGLARLGLRGLEVGGRRGAAAPSYVCFRALGESEVAWRGRKLVGSAQRRLGPALLQHGSIPLSGSAEGLACLVELEGEAGPASGAPPADLEEAAGRFVAVREASDAVAAGFAAVLGARFETAPLEPVEEARIASLVEECYAREAFLLRV